MRINACSLLFSSQIPDEDFLSLSQDKPRFLTYFSGRYTYLDFFLSSTYHAGARKQLLVTSAHAELVHSYMEQAWKEDEWSILPFIPEEGDQPFDKQMFAVLKESLSPWVFFGQVDHPIYFDGAELVSSLPKRKKVIIPIIERKSPPIVLVDKTLLLDQLSQAVKKKMAASSVLPFCLKNLRKHAKAVKVDVSGYYRDIKSLDGYITANFEVLRKAAHFNSLFERAPLQSVVGEKGQAVIERGASFIESLVGDRSIIHGSVERSIIFPDVVIGKNAQIVDSIIMPNVIIGANAKITKTLIDEGMELPQNERAHIGPNAAIGKLQASQPNQTAPDILGNGYSYISTGVMVPRGVKIGANCYLAPGIGKINFRRVKNISDGRSLLPASSKK